MKYDIRQTYKNRMITKKQLQEIDNRRLYALKMNDYTAIEDAKTKVLSIIDTDGLDNEEQKTRLDTAIKIMPYIMPQKKAIETTVIHRKLEDIITEHIEEAEIIDDKKADTMSDNNANV